MLDTLRTTAEEAARAGGLVLRERAANMGDVRTKTTAYDMVTDADIASGIAVTRTILDRFPTAGIVVEEPEVHHLLGLAPSALDDAEVWVIDPLDGTTSFIHGYPCFSVSVACLHDGQPVAGAVYNVPLDEMTSAATGTGATRNGTPIRCSTVADLARALLVTGFPYDRTALLDRQLRVFGALMRTAHGVRRDGSAAVDCCHVASGRTDAFWEFGLQPWDMAAGVIVLREAGARATTLAGEPWGVHASDIVAANAALHGVLLEAIASTGVL